MGNTAKTQEIESKALDRDTKALELRCNGLSYEAISDQLGYGGRSNAHRAVNRRLQMKRDECAEKADEVRQIECLRLDIAMAAISSRVREGELLAIDRMLRLQDRRAAYLGLDQPKGLKVEMARELDGFIGRLREEFDDDVYERVLALIAGEYGGEAPPSVQDHPGAEEGPGDRDAGEGPPPPATGE